MPRLPAKIPIVQHSAGSIMLRGCLAASGSAAQKNVHGIMKNGYLHIRQENLKSSAEDWLLCGKGVPELG